jgi:hypothetical protein
MAKSVGGSYNSFQTIAISIYIENKTCSTMILGALQTVARQLFAHMVRYAA